MPPSGSIKPQPSPGRGFFDVANRGMNHVETSEAMGAGHPDKVADLISDTILDSCLTEYPASRVGCEVLVKGGTVIVAGEITTAAKLNIDHLVRQAVREAGYRTAEDDPVFNAESLSIINLLTQQSGDIALGVNAPEQGAGDQGIMYGYACSDTTELMPMPIALASLLMRELDAVRPTIEWMRPDSKCQVSVEYDEGGHPLRVSDVVLSTQHAPFVNADKIRAWCDDFIRKTLPADMVDDGTRIVINPTGRFVIGGPQADCGLTGRKIIADTYGGIGRHGGGAFSGKDCSKVDRSGAYMCRWVAKHIVAAGLAKRCSVQVSYAIGKAEPVSMRIETDASGDAEAISRKVQDVFSFRPADIERELGLRAPIFRGTTNYGHFGKAYLPWEQLRPDYLASLAE